MKVFAVSDNRYIIRPEDGKDFAVVVQIEDDDSVKVYPRTNSAESIARFGEWEEPSEAEIERASKVLKDFDFPDPIHLEEDLQPEP